MAKRMMAIVVAMAIMLPMTPSAEAAKSPKLAKCDGKHRRTANPYGTILPSVDAQSGSVTPANAPTDARAIDVFPERGGAPAKRGASDGKAEPVVPPISAIALPTHYRSC